MSNRLKPSLRKYLANYSKAHDAAVTLTLKQQDTSGKLDENEAQINLRHFLNRLNKKAFGNASVRFNKRIEVIPVLETSYSGRLHYHLSMKNPFPSIAELEQAVLDCWNKTRWGYQVNDIQEVYNAEGWINYITKQSGSDHWDISNTNLA